MKVGDSEDGEDDELPCVEVKVKETAWSEVQRGVHFTEKVQRSEKSD